MTVFMATAQTDAYKLFHKKAYHPEITHVYSNFTSRSGKLSYTKDGVVFVGLQYFIKDVLIDEWNNTFFKLPKHLAIINLKRVTDSMLGFDYDASHFEQLHDLGYLPISIKALPEGVLVPYGVPPVTFFNTIKGFQWLTNYIETVFSTENWPIQTSATTAREYLKNTINMFNKIGEPLDLVPFMCHDFSFRGCFGRHAAAMSGFGHLTSFAGTDTLPAILFAEKYYNADCTKELVGVSVPATEHSTATSYIVSISEELDITKLQAEIKYVEYLMEQVPTGIVSHVSDSFDFWEFVKTGLPALKNKILARDGKLVIRPDSGDPVLILCGDPDSSIPEERKGLIECLYDIFGGTMSGNGYILLEEHIGAIYGDSITIERQQEIYERLLAKGFAPTVILGIGSFSYQFVTRDTHGSAVKATSIKKANKDIDVFKDPKTDSKKKSAKGLLRVEKENNTFVLYDQQTSAQEAKGELSPVFLNGKLLRETSLEEIRNNVLASL